jgi:hypothetical protein
VPAGASNAAATMGDYGPGNFLIGLWKGLTTPGAELRQQLEKAGPGETAGAIVGRVPVGQIIDQIRQGGALLQRGMETGELAALPGTPLAPGGVPASAEEMVGNALLGMTAPVTRLPGGPITRLERAPTGELREAPIGGLPESADFADAARAVTNRPALIPPILDKLQQLWRKHGIHPAEVAHDAARDPTIAQDLASSTSELPAAYAGEQQPRAMPGRPAVPDQITQQPVIPEPTTRQGTTAQIPPQLRSFAPGELRVDPQRFQFKSGADAAGVGDRLQGVTQWDPLKAGLAIVFEDRDGAHWIADGHQRLGLATRIESADPAQQPRLNAWVLREADGITDATARAYAAAKNIAEGTGTAIDAAKVLRDQPDLLPGLPPRSELVRQAKGLMTLDGEAFGKVVNELVPANYGAIVGRLAPEDGAMQNALIDLLAKTQPENAVQAEAVVRQGLDAGLRRETQGTLFGDEDLVSSLYLERARILDRAVKLLRRDRTVFQSLVDNRKIVEELGNQLAADENLRRAAIDGHAAQILQTLANRKGPLSDALTAAARDLAEGRAGLAAVSRDFVAAIRRSAADGTLGRSADGGSASPVAAPGEGRPAPDTAGRGAEPAAAPVEQAPRDVSPAEEARAAERVAEAIRAYHGTPHTFEAEPGAPLGRFQLDKIGTGEGAQTYGFGIYLAGHPQVAGTYRQQQMAGSRRFVEELERAELPASAKGALQLTGRRYFDDTTPETIVSAAYAQIPEARLDIEAHRAAAVSAVAQAQQAAKAAGSLYEVKI